MTSIKYATNFKKIPKAAFINAAFLLGACTSEEKYTSDLFDFNQGGDPVYFQHFLWFFGHYEIYIPILILIVAIFVILIRSLQRRRSKKTSNIHTESFGKLSWLVEQDHKKNVARYLIFILISAITYMAVSLTLHMELAESGMQYFANTQSYSTLMTFQGFFLNLYVVFPIVTGIFWHGIIAVRAQGQSLAFPRLSALAFWLLITGFLCFLTFICLPTPALGEEFGGDWVMYPPLTESGSPTPHFGLIRISFTLAGISVILNIANILASLVVLPTRTPKVDDLREFNLKHELKSLYATWFYAFLMLLIAGCLSGYAMANASVDQSLHDTYYIKANFAYLISICLPFILFGGLYLLFDKVFRLFYHKALAWLQSILYFIGMSLVILPQLHLNFAGMQSRNIDYAEQYEKWNNISAFGGLICGISAAAFILVVIEALVKRRNISQ